MNLKEPFRLQDALSAGHSRRALTSGAYRRLSRGVYVHADTRLDAFAEGKAALLLAGEEAFLSHHQAARLYGAFVPPSATVHASIAGNRHRSRRREISVHRSSRTPTRFRGLPLTTPEDTFVDLAEHLSLVDLVVLGDSLVRIKRTVPDRLLEASANGPQRLRARAVRAAGLVRAGVDSAMETRSRLLIVLAGLPEPEVNICFYDERGELRRRTEMGYRRQRLAIEYDGRHHAESQTQWESDVARREEFDGADWRIITLLAKDIYRTPRNTLDRVISAMRQAGINARVTNDEWRWHFPGQ